MSKSWLRAERGRETDENKRGGEGERERESEREREREKERESKMTGITR